MRNGWRRESKRAWRATLSAAGLAAALALTAGRAAASTWTGAGDGVKWSDAANWDAAPAKNAAIVFTTSAAGATVIDADFTVDQVGSVTLPADWAGSVTQQKDITFGGNSGIFTMNGGTWNVNGKKVTSAGHFRLNGGSFNAASSDFVQGAGNFDFLHKGGTLQGGRFVYYRNQNHSLTLTGSVFDSMKMTSSDGLDRSANTMGFRGTTFEVLGDLRIETFTFSNSGGTIKLHGDAYFAHNMSGGYPRIVFVGGGAHKVVFADPATAGRLICGFSFDVTDGSTVTVTSDNGIGALGWRYATASYFVITNGTLDASSMDELKFRCGGSENSTPSRIGLDGVFKVPQRTTFEGAGFWKMNGLTFKDMGWNLTGNGLIMDCKTTNYITGNVYSHGASLWSLNGGGPRSTAAAQFRLDGDLICDNDGSPGRGIYAGSAQLVFAGTDDQTIYATNAILQLCMVIDKTNGTVRCKTTDYGLHFRCNEHAGSGRDSPGIWVKRGALDLTDADVTFDSSYSGSFWQEPGTTLIVTNTTFTSTGYLHAFRILGPIEALSLSLSSNDQNPPYECMTTTVTRSFYWSSGRIGTYSTPYKPVCFDLKGDLFVTNVALGSSAEFRFTGTGDQHVSMGSNSQPSNGDIIIDKPSGRVVLDSDLDTTKGYYWRTGSRDMIANHKRGEVDLNGHRFIARGTYALGAGATLVGDGAGQAIATKSVTVADGAAVLWKPPAADATLAAVVCASNTLTLPAAGAGTVTAGIRPVVRKTTPEVLPLFAYAKLANAFAPDGWAFDMAPKTVRPRILHDADAKRISLRYLFARPLKVILR